MHILSDHTSNKSSNNVNKDIYNRSQISLLYSSPAYAAVFATYPIIFLLNHYGSRCILTIVGLLSAFATFSIPFAVNYSTVYFVTILRLIQGIKYGNIVKNYILGIGIATIITAIGSITSAWSPLTENGIFVSLLSAFQHLSPIITMPISSIFCNSPMFGWPSIYYLHGLVTAILFILFAFYYRDNCKDHSSVGKIEYERIINGKCIYCLL
jgi:nitrate/nitrite transporter NarK